MMRIKNLIVTALFVAAAVMPTMAAYDAENPVPGRWSEKKINDWYAKLPWLVGSNYYPATAINQIDMWQASTWDPKQIEKELDWASAMGMNTMRVFLHDLVWADDEKGLYDRMDQFLDICADRGIKPWFVFFDDCHFPNPKLGVQPAPVRKYHNSGWVNCPARDVAVRYANGEATDAEVAQLKGYVQKTMRHFAKDKRVLFWELYNEPGRGKGINGTMAGQKGNNIGDLSAQLIYDSWVWAREVNPSQPVTSCTRGSVGNKNIAINHINSDLFSVHSYQGPDGIRKMVAEHKGENRPVIFSEWLGRRGSNPQACLPVFKELNAGCTTWGFVSGKAGTVWNWKSRVVKGKPRDVDNERANGNIVKPGEPMPEPEIWWHDLYRMDGTPYSQDEIDTFKKLTKGNKKFK